MDTLQQAGFEAYAVGGSVRDLLLGLEPRDWDVTTSAKPEEILKLFPESFYENKFLTVTVKTDSENPVLKEIEVTTYRAEGKYSDKRHPDEIRFAETLEEDLSRRDFTVNALALSPSGEIMDPFKGQKDLQDKLLRAVGDPEKRLAEDALRMLRSARLAMQLGFEIEDKTVRAMKKLAGNLEFIAKERIRDELIKIIMTPRAKDGFELLHELGLLKYIIPKLEEGIGIDQRGPHKYHVWEHNLKALEYAARENYSLRVRLAALLHDIAKPHTRVRRDNIWTFYGHDVVGSKMAYAILTRLHFPAKECEAIATLVRWHLFSYKLKRDEKYLAELKEMGENPAEKDIEDAEDMQETTDSAIRRLIRRVGEDNIQDLVQVRICDRVATGVPKAVPYRLRHFQFRVEKILREGEATNVGMLEIDGGEIMKNLDIVPGPRVGHILNALLEEVMDEPERNNSEYLQKRSEELNKMSDEELKKLREQSEERVEKEEEEREREIKRKFKVK